MDRAVVKRAWLRALLLPLLLAVAVACGERHETGASESGAPPAQPAPAAIAAPEPAPVARAESSGGAVALPKDYPTDAPAYPGASPIISEEAADGRLSVVFRSGDAGEAIHAWVRAFLKEQGWKLESDLAMGDQYALDATKPDRRIAVLTARDPSTDACLVTVLVSR